MKLVETIDLACMPNVSQIIIALWWKMLISMYHPFCEFEPVEKYLYDILHELTWRFQYKTLSDKIMIAYVIS